MAAVSILKESVTSLTGTGSFSSSRGDCGVGGVMNRTMKSYRMDRGVQSRRTWL